MPIVFLMIGGRQSDFAPPLHPITSRTIVHRKFAASAGLVPSVAFTRAHEASTLGADALGVAPRAPVHRLFSHGTRADRATEQGLGATARDDRVLVGIVEHREGGTPLYYDAARDLLWVRSDDGELVGFTRSGKPVRGPQHQR